MDLVEAVMELSDIVERQSKLLERALLEIAQLKAIKEEEDV